MFIRKEIIDKLGDLFPDNLYKASQWSKILTWKEDYILRYGQPKTLVRKIYEIR